MANLDDILSGVIQGLDASEDPLSLWEFDKTNESIKLIHHTRSVAGSSTRREAQQLVPTITMIIKGLKGSSFRQNQDALEHNFGELYVDTVYPVDGSHYYIVKYSRVPFPFELEHRPRSKKVSDLEKKITHNIIHELLTPINSMQGLNEQLSDALLDPSSQELVTTHAQTCSLIKTHIIDIINYISLQTSEARAYTKEPFDLLETLFSVSSKANRSIHENGRKLCYKLHYPTDYSSLPIVGHPELLEHTLLYLIDNAIKFTPDGSSITVDIAITPNKTLSFSVTDTGCGIAKDKQRIIFRPFILGDMEDTKTHCGLGLGLSSAQESVIIMSGNANAGIRLETAPGRGSTFSFELPFEAATGIRSEGERNLPLPHDPQVYRILVAEDNPTQQMIIDRLIRKLGYQSRVVPNGIEVIGEYIRRDTHYDLILMDIQMPGISGHEAAKIIRKYEKKFGLVRVPIIAITANIEKDVHSESLRAGMDGHYGKPVTRVLLDNLIRKSLLGISL